MPNSAPTLDPSTFEVVGTLDDAAIEALAELLVAFDEAEETPTQGE